MEKSVFFNEFQTKLTELNTVMLCYVLCYILHVRCELSVKIIHLLRTKWHLIGLAWLTACEKNWMI